ncbi:AmmeMemoRadiSam system radical SAM enzyme [Bacillota bacterium]
MRQAIKCEICPRSCLIPEGEKGFCGGRANKEGKIIADNYGKIMSIALDPIEKKPLMRFHPGSSILSVGSYGCNLRCSFCQNHTISMEKDPECFIEMTPEELAARSLSLVPMGNIGIAYTYNEPLIGYEFVMDCAKTAAGKGLLNVVVSNGCINERPLRELLPFIHAMNIDLKSFSPKFYKDIGGDLELVKNSIRLAAAECHLEVTNLVIPGENDGPQEMRELARWLASVDPQIPLHISRFHPAYKMSDRKATPYETIDKLAEIAGEHLQYVYQGNINNRK